MADYIEGYLQSLGYAYQVGRGKYYEVSLVFDDGRKQKVYIGKNCERVSGVDFREIWSPAGKLSDTLSSQVALRLLENNSYRTVGAWGYNANKKFVYFSCKVPDTLTEAQLDAIMIAVAGDADCLEQKLFGEEDAM